MYIACAPRSVPLGSWPAIDVATLQGIPDGPAGTLATLREMRRLIRKDAMTPDIRNLALSIIQPVQPYDFAGEARALQAWVQQNIRYTRDTTGVETLVEPVYLLGSPAGDCDDLTMLYAALAMSIGLPVRIVKGQRGRFAHVWPEVNLQGHWITAETTRPVPLGYDLKLPRDLIVSVTDDDASMGGFFSSITHAFSTLFKVTVRDPIKGLEDLVRHGGKAALGDWTSSFADAVDFAHEITPKFIYRTVDKALPIIQKVGVFIPVWGWAVSAIATAAQIGLKINAAKEAGKLTLADHQKNGRLAVDHAMQPVLATAAAQNAYALAQRQNPGLNWNDVNVQYEARMGIVAAIESKQNGLTGERAETEAMAIAASTLQDIGAPASTTAIAAGVNAVLMLPTAQAGQPGYAGPAGASRPSSLPLLLSGFAILVALI